MEYNFREVEKKWQSYWAEKKTFRAENNSSKPKYYVLDMFPYPSGAGLHVGHPLGYIASDIYARFKRLKGFNVLHPMGYDAFGLPAEQYAIQTGQHPAVTTEQNINRYREQLDNIGFSFDWEREIRTSDPDYYKWTQWIFLKLFNSWYNPETDKAESIDTLIEKFNVQRLTFKTGAAEKLFSELSDQEASDVLMNYRLAFLGEAFVNWCPALGTVLANDEVKDGVSERGGYPVERKKMKQWSMRITSYAQRLLDDLETIDWSESIKEQQRNWIGRSEGASVKFKVQSSNFDIEVFTTRPDTIFGATFMTLAPEHELVEQITTAEQKEAVQKYVEEAKNRSDRERMTEVKRITGVFTGAYAENPFSKKSIPIWIGDYVLSGYGTGAVMAVPAHDERDHAFAKHFGLEIKQVIETPADWNIQEKSFDSKDSRCINSDFINGLQTKEAIKKIVEEVEKRKIGEGKINFRLRDAVFGRQRYWGEPIPIYYENGIPKPVDEKDLPVILPEVDKYLPTEDGEPPLARATNWKYKGKYDYELTTMPGWAGSSWYFLRYMDSKNEKEFASKEAINYWKDVDLYIGGSEHATGHLLYVRFWTKFLFDLGLIPVQEPAKKLINQGMIQGVSQFIFKYRTGNISWASSINRTKANFFYYRLPDNSIKEHILKDTNGSETLFAIFYSYDVLSDFGESVIYDDLIIEENDKEFRMKTIPERVDVNAVSINNELNIKSFIDWKNEYQDAIFLCKGGYWQFGKFQKYPELNTKDLSSMDGSEKFYTRNEVEKMSKSKYNVVNPDDIINQHGADALRLYEMFLGPLELSKPWNTNGITGVSSFIRKLWRLYHQKADGQQSTVNSGQSTVDSGQFFVSDVQPTKQELKSLHKLIKKVTEDIERFSFNTSVSNFMICVNELTDLKCNKRSVLEPLAVLVSPYAPHVAEELWQKLGHKESITFAKWMEHNEEYLVEDSFAYPISVNGKTKFNLEIALGLSKDEIEKEVMTSEEVKKVLQGQPPKKVIIVPGRIVNIVV